MTRLGDISPIGVKIFIFISLNTLQARKKEKNQFLEQVLKKIEQKFGKFLAQIIIWQAKFSHFHWAWATYGSSVSQYKLPNAQK